MSTDDLDPAIRSLFAITRTEPADDGFTRQLLQKIEAQTARRKRLRLMLGAALPTLIGLFTTFGGLDILTQPLIPAMPENLISEMLAPLNSLATVLGALALGLSQLLRRVLR